MVKIKHIEINGLRGIKKTISVSLDSSQSILIFGENGSGKSSITDAFEWFYNDKVEHLSSEEIGRGGIEALRNIFLQPDQEAYAGLKFSESKYNSIKKLFYNKSKLSTEIDNSTKEFEDYINSSTSENLILRYGDLLKFILASKGDKLRGISQIIGYEEVQKIKEIFKNERLFILFVFSISQWLIWWYLPPVSTRYAISGFISMLILEISVLKTFNSKLTNNKILILLALFAFINFIPRIFVNIRSLKYLLGNQTQKEYIEQFYDGSIDQKLKDWYKY